MAPNTSYPDPPTEADQQLIMRQAAQNTQAALKKACTLMLGAPVLAWGTVAVFFPFWPSLAYIAAALVFELGLCLEIRRSRPVFEPGKWSPGETILLHRYFFNLRYSIGAICVSAALRFVSVLSLLWGGWLAYNGYAVLAVLMATNVAAQLWLSWRLDPTAFGMGKAATDLICIQRIVRERESGVPSPTEPQTPEGTAAGVALFERRARHGDADAMYALAEALMTGSGMPKDEKRAVALYRQSIECNDRSAAWVSEAMYNLAQMRLNGQGTRQDYAEARKWFLKAAELGVSDAMVMVGRLHDTGRGVPEDALEAFKWYEKAAALGNANAMVSMSAAFGTGLGVAVDGEKSLRWSKQAAELGDPRGMFNLGVIYLKGEWVEQDLEKALTWLRKSERAGNPDATALVAQIDAAT